MLLLIKLLPLLIVMGEVDSDCKGGATAATLVGRGEFLAQMKLSASTTSNRETKCE